MKGRLRLILRRALFRTLNPSEQLNYYIFTAIYIKCTRKLEVHPSFKIGFYPTIDSMPAIKKVAV
jgi:hypothetical protein